MVKMIEILIDFYIKKIVNTFQASIPTSVAGFMQQQYQQQQLQQQQQQQQQQQLQQQVMIIYHLLSHLM